MRQFVRPIFRQKVLTYWVSLTIISHQKIVCLKGEIMGLKSTIILAALFLPFVAYGTKECTDNRSEGVAERKCGKTDGWSMVYLNDGNGISFLNGLKMEFLRFESGSFTMGSPENKVDRNDDENPVEVALNKAFEFGKYEVTQRQWFEVMDDNPSHFSTREYCENYTEFKTERGESVGMCPEHPVERVSWSQVKEFLKRLNEKMGFGDCSGREKKHYNMPRGCHRLPTEAEWEYAVRKGGEKNGVYSFGDDSEFLRDYGWYQKNSREQTHPVGEKEALDRELHDVHGNVWEWVQDGYHWVLPGGTNPLQTELTIYRIIRGGGWNDDARELRSASRHLANPDKKINEVGFRIVRSL